MWSKVNQIQEGYSCHITILVCYILASEGISCKGGWTSGDHFLVRIYVCYLLSIYVKKIGILFSKKPLGEILLNLVLGDPVKGLIQLGF